MRCRLFMVTVCLLVLSGRTDNVLLTSVAEAKRLTDDACQTPRSFAFTGKVLTEDEQHWFFDDGSGGIEIHNRTLGPRAFSPGTVIGVRGEMSIMRNGARRFFADAVEIHRTEQPASPVDATPAAVLNGSMDFRLVRIKGVISAVVPDEVTDSTCWASLRTSSGKVYLTFSNKRNDIAALQRAIDAEVVVTGLAAPTTGLRRNLGHRISVDKHDSIVVVKQPPADPFSAPDLSDADLPHRQKARGVVLAAEPRRLFLKTAAGCVIPASPATSSDSTLPVAGDLVTVVGFATDDPYRTQLTDILVRIDGHATNPTDRPVPVSLQSLFINEKGQDRIESHVDGTIISVRGRVSAVSPGELRVAEGPYAISLDIPTLQTLDIPVPADGSQIAVSGLCLVEFENSPTPTIFPTFKRFSLVPRDKTDLIILSSPPWWTPYRLTLLVIALAAVLIGSALWNVMLKRKSEKRGKELYEEKIDHALAEQKVEERTRLAVELHDSVSQTLTGVALQLDGGEIETAKTMLASCRGELRRCLWDLRSRTFEEKDMTEAITRTITPHLNGCAATIRFNVPRERPSESLTHAILRIVRELTVNAIRHGQAQHIRVAGEMHGNSVSFSVSDDGRGFDPNKAPGPEEGHFGLLGIRERVEGFNGELKIESSLGRGSKFMMTLRASDDTNGQ